MGVYSGSEGGTQVEFIECTSMNISYDVMGRVSISYTVVHTTKEITPFPTGVPLNQIEAGGRTYKGYVVNASMNQIPKTNWYETHVTFIATTD